MPERRRRAERYGVNVELSAPVRSRMPESQPSAPQRIPMPEPEELAPLPPPEDPVNDAPVPAARELLATNTGVRLACTMAAMMGVFAIFLCWAEKESRVIRRFSVQSACLTALHAILGAAALIISAILGAIPYVGLMVSLMCLLGYIAGLILLVVARVLLMRSAWQGVRFVLPRALERIIHRYY